MQSEKCTMKCFFLHFTKMDLNLFVMINQHENFNHIALKYWCKLGNVWNKQQSLGIFFYIQLLHLSMKKKLISIFYIFSSHIFLVL